MELTQILIFLLCLVPALTCFHRCLDEEQLQILAQKKLAKQNRSVPPAYESPSSACPLELFATLRSQQVNVRSVAPWRMISVTNHDLFPPVYQQAECLCTGCILFNSSGGVEENHNYNIKPIIQKRMFLQRERCINETNKYRLKRVTIDVTVGCTCAWPFTP